MLKLNKLKIKKLFGIVVSRFFDSEAACEAVREAT